PRQEHRGLCRQEDAPQAVGQRKRQVPHPRLLQQRHGARLAAMDLPLEEHLEDVVDALCAGALVPLLGAGANLSDRAEGETWRPGQNLPSGVELAEYLADKLHYPEPETANDLLRVSQYGQARRGDGTLFRFLHEVFTQRYVPTRLHDFLATLPSRLE